MTNFIKLLQNTKKHPKQFNDMNHTAENHFKTQLNRIKKVKTHRDIIHLKRLIESVKNQLTFYQYSGLLGALNNHVKNL